MSEPNDNQSQTLTDSQQYYIRLFERWQKMSTDEQVKIDQPQQIFDFSSKIPKEYWDAFADYFAGFKGFVKRAKGKSIGMELNVNGDFKFRVYSDNADDLIGIDKELQDFLKAVPYFMRNPLVGYNLMNTTGKVDPNMLIMESQVSALATQLRMVEVGKIWAEQKNIELEIKIEELSNDIEVQVKENFLLQHNSKTIIYTEGKTDVDYLKIAIKVLGYTDLENVDIQEIGKQENGETKDGGVANLNKFFDANKNKTELFPHKIILLYDCDAKQKYDSVNNRLFKIGIEPNEQNTEYEVGIENLLPQHYFEDEKYWETKIITENKNGVRKEIKSKSLRKTQLCEYICSQRLKEDFKYFVPILNKLTVIFSKS